jgi:hypothetical protein
MDSRNVSSAARVRLSSRWRSADFLKNPIMMLSTITMPNNRSSGFKRTRESSYLSITHHRLPSACARPGSTLARSSVQSDCAIRRCNPSSPKLRQEVGVANSGVNGCGSTALANAERWNICRLMWYSAETRPRYHHNRL